MRRKILITGATSGIGLALATRLAPRHDVIATGRVSKMEASAILPANIRYIEAAQDNPAEAAARIVDGLADAEITGLDNVVLNAGTGFMGDPHTETPQRIRNTLDVNLASTVVIAHALYPHLAKRGGRLTLIGSTAARGSSRIASYAASKAGLGGFARALRSEWKGRVSVQILHPGPTATAMHEKAGYDPGRLRSLFLSPVAMGAMLEYAIARGRSPVTLWWARYIAGEAIFGRRL